MKPLQYIVPKGGAGFRWRPLHQYQRLDLSLMRRAYSLRHAASRRIEQGGSN